MLVQRFATTDRNSEGRIDIVYPWRPTEKDRLFQRETAFFTDSTEEMQKKLQRFASLCMEKTDGFSGQDV